MTGAPARAIRTMWMAALALLVGPLLVALYDAALGSTRYPYYADSASYVEMARSIVTEGRPRVTPWGLGEGDVDAVPQPLFPPGFPALTAALSRLTGDVRSAALLPNRVAAAALPLLLVLLWRGAATPATLFALGIWVLVSPGVREWQFLAYSDVLALALAVVALGLAARLLGEKRIERPDRASALPWLVTGFAAALCYTVRNAGLAVLGAVAASLPYASARGYIDRRALVLFGLGAAPPLIALAAYNLSTFGRLQPYGMPPSARAWPLNLLDYATAQLEDLGLPRALGEWLPPVALPILLGILFAALLAAWWRARGERWRHALLTVLGLYALAGAALLIISRSRYEWADHIDVRYASQYSFALALALLVGAPLLLPAKLRRIGAILLLALLAVNLVIAAQTAFDTRRRAAESWLTLANDRSLIARIRAIPEATYIASNTAPLFRVAAGRPARQLDVGGDDGDFAGSLALIRAAAGSRPAVMLLVCNEWTWGFSACHAGLPAGGPACTPIRSDVPTVLLCPTDGSVASPKRGDAPSS